jgi:hypothetical protein
MFLKQRAFYTVNGVQLFEHTVMYLFLFAFESLTGTLRTKTWSYAMGGCGPLKWGPLYQHQVPGMLIFNVLNTHVLDVLAVTSI